jgi:hypothetical protein
MMFAAEDKGRFRSQRSRERSVQKPAVVRTVVFLEPMGTASYRFT